METLAVGAVPPSGGGETDAAGTVRRLILASSLMLFLELALIRWLGANVVHLAYFSNFVLLGSFLGIGAGFLISRKSWSVSEVSLPLLAVLVCLVYAFPVTIERTGSDLIFFTAVEVTGPPAWLALPVVFALVAIILAGPAEAVGRCFAQLAPLTAYRYDLIGSLLGIAGFTALSFLHAPSVVWGVIAVGLYLALANTGRRVIALLWAALLLTVLTFETLIPGVSWSPYNKISVVPHIINKPGFLIINANGVPHQLMAPAKWKLEQGERYYEAPYLRLPKVDLGEVLIIGAGSGSDVAIALSKGSRRVDAVEIDPGIFALGVRHNIDRPYADPRVTRHIDDGRAFLERSGRKYDLILFALPDSLTLVQGASQIRLESFLFTEEAMRSVRAHLKPGGGFAMYNYYREDWLINRLAGTVAGAFGHAPCIDTYEAAQAIVSIAHDPANQSCATTWSPGPGAKLIEPSNDNRPFLYFKGGSFPPVYAAALAAILLVSLLTVRILGGPFGAMRPYADLFFMGAAFLLLETKNIATFALLFGTTWLVNALVFLGVLGIVLAAVETTRKFRTPPLPVIFAGIAASLALAWFIRPEWLLALPFGWRLLAATLLAFLPIYLANVAFAKRFMESGDTQSAFAINLLGTVVGGCLEYSALALGYNNLLIVTGLLYLTAFLLVPKAAGVRA